MTQVINVRHAPPKWQRNPRFVYVGRPGRGLDGEWGNPHALGNCPACGAWHDRAKAVAAHAAEVRGRFALDPAYATRVRALRGKVLVCFCKPLACHGDVLAELADGA